MLFEESLAELSEQGAMAKSSYSLVLVISAVFLSVAGAIISGVLLQHHVVAQIGGDPMLEGVCEAAASFSCDEVIASRWGKLELGAGERKVVIPTAMLGFAFFAAMGSWYVTLGTRSGQHRCLRFVPVVLAAGGLLGAIGFEYLMFFVLGKLCPLCMATHVVIVFLFVAALLVNRVAGEGPAEDAGGPGARGARSAGGLVLTALLLGGVATGLGWFIYKARLSEGYAHEYFVRWQDYDRDTRLNYDRFLDQPVVDIPIGPEDPVRGPADAKHTVVVFSDFMCPACQGMELTVLEQRRKEFPGEFRIVFKHFPLDKTCNPELKNTLHPNACAAAVGVEAIRLLKGNDAFWAMHDAVFHNARRFTTELAITKAAELGIDRETYMNMFKKTSTWDRIHANVAEGRRLGLDSTPALFFDGRPLKPWGDRHLWRYLLSDETLKSPVEHRAG